MPARPALPLRSLFISDLHLGVRGYRVDAVPAFLNHTLFFRVSPPEAATRGAAERPEYRQWDAQRLMPNRARRPKAAARAPQIRSFIPDAMNWMVRSCQTAAC